MNPEAKVYVFYKDIRTPGQYENFYRRVQEDEGIFMTKGEVAAVIPETDGSVTVEVDDTLLGEKIRVRADLVVLATGMVPRTALGEEEVQAICEENDKQKKDKQEDMASRLLIPTKIIKSERAEPRLPSGSGATRPEIRVSRFSFHLLPVRDPPDGHLRRRIWSSAHGHSVQRGGCQGRRAESYPVR